MDRVILYHTIPVLGIVLLVIALYLYATWQRACLLAKAKEQTRQLEQTIKQLEEEIAERVRFEEALSQSEAHVRALLEAIPDTILHFSEDGTILYAKPPKDYVTPTQYEQYIGKHISEVDADVAEYVTFHVQKALRSGTTELCEYQVTRCGKKEYREARYVALNDHEVLSLVRDITKRVEIESELHQYRKHLQELVDARTREIEEQRAFLRKIIDVSPNQIFVKDADSRFILVNEAVAQSEGRTVEELIGKTEAEIHPYPDEVEVYIKQDRQVLETLQEMIIPEEKITDIQGETRFYRVIKRPFIAPDGKTRLVLAVAMDITEQKKAEEALRLSEQRLRLLIDTMPVLVNAFDENDVCVLWNRECERVTGYSAEEILGKPEAFGKLYPGPERLREIERFSREKRGRDYSDWELALTCKDGSERTISWRNVSKLFPIPGWSSWAVGVDVTARKILEAELRRSAEQKELLLREIHHRVKNNLSIVISLLNLHRRFHEDAVLNTMLQEIELRIRSMVLIHQQLYRSANIDYVPFGDYLRTLAGTIAAAYHRPNIHLSFNLTAANFNVETATPCGLIFTELLTNAYKHAFPDGRQGAIRVEFEMAGEDCDVAVSSGENDVWRLTVRDDGIGLPQGFDWKTADSLGMHIIRLLVQQLDGRLSVTGVDGCGFSLYFSESRYPDRTG